MAEEAARATFFDHKERARVRRTLLRYMAEHTIRVPTLQSRIIDADKPRHRVIPLSTLQRFLAGSRRTSDHHVALCQSFARRLPYYQEGRDLEQFGEALFGFLRGPVQAGEREALAAQLVSEFAGTYQSEASRLTLTALDGQPYLQAREFGRPLLAPDELSERAAEELSARRRAREGVMVLIPPYIYIFLRDNLTRQPKLCCLRRLPAEGEDPKTLDGWTFQPPFLAGMGPMQGHVRFDPAAAREQD